MESPTKIDKAGLYPWEEMYPVEKCNKEEVQLLDGLSTLIIDDEEH